MCAGGMSSSLLANKIRDEGKLRYGDVQVSAYGVMQTDKVDEETNVVLLAPQVSYMYDKLVSQLKNTPVLKIEMLDYGRLNAENILDSVDKSIKL